MAKISHLPPAETLSGDEIFPILQRGENRRGVIDDLNAFFQPIVDEATAARDEAVASAETTRANRLTLGERARRSIASVTVQNGANVITAHGVPTGFTIPAASTGRNSVAFPIHEIAAEVAARYAGSVIRVKTVADLSAGFLAAKPLTVAPVQIQYRDGTPLNSSTGALVRSETVDNRLYREATFILAANVYRVGTVIQVVSNANANADHSLNIVSSTLTCDSVPAGATWSVQDVAAALAGAGYRSGIGPIGSETLRQADPQAGATVRASTSGVGITIPAGQTGIASNLIARIPVTSDWRGLLAGAMVEVRIPVTHSAVFTRTLAPELQKNGTTILAKTNAEMVQLTPTERLYVYRFAASSFDGLETLLAPYIRVISGDAAATEEFFEIDFTRASFTVVGTSQNQIDAGQINEAIRTARSQTKFDSGNLLDLIGTVGNASYAAVGTGMSPRIDSLGRALGWTLPMGVTPSGTVIQARAAFDGARYLGRRLKLRLVCDTSANLVRTPSLTLQVLTAAGVVTRTATVLRNAQSSANRRVIEATYLVTGDEKGLWPYLSPPGGGAAAVADEYLLITDFLISFMSNGSDVNTPSDDTLRLFGASVRSLASLDAMNLLLESYAVTVTVKPTGGDYTHPKLALDAITDASFSRRYKIAIYPGVYDAYAEWHTKDYVDLFGVGRRQDIVISYANPNSASAATIANTSTFWLDSTSRIENLTVEITNGRYAIHLETNGGKVGSVQRIVNCAVTHKGNLAAINNTWSEGSQYAVGAGNSSGQQIIARGSTFTGPGGGFSYHTPNNRVAYDRPTTTDLEGCRFVATGSGRPSLTIKPICVGAGDRCRLVGNTFVGDVVYSASEWLDTADTTSNRAQIQVYGHANAGFNFVNQISGAGAEYRPDMTGV